MVGAGYVTVAPDAEPQTVMFVEQTIVGGRLSTTVTVNVQGALVFPAASVAVQVTVVVPFEKNEPDGGLQVTVRPPGQLSVAVAANATLASHLNGLVFAVMLAGQVTVGG